MRLDLPHPLAGGGTVPLVANPLRFSDTPVAYDRAPPVLGADTEDVIREILGPERLRAAQEDGALG